jgi:hypothetical protein
VDRDPDAAFSPLRGGGGYDRVGRLRTQCPGIPLPHRSSHPKTEWFKWISLVRKHMGLPEFSYRDKVRSRIGKDSLSIPLEKGERLMVWLGVILAFLVIVTAGVIGTYILAGVALFIVLGGAFVISTIWGAVAGFFRS